MSKTWTNIKERNLSIQYVKMCTVLSEVDRDVLGVLVKLELNKYASPAEGFKREYHCGYMFSNIF